MRISIAPFKSRLFLYFFVSVGIHKANYLLSLLTGVNIQGTIGVTLLVFPLLFLVLVDMSSTKSFGVKTMISRDKNLFLVLFLLVIAFALGLINGNSKDIIFQEIWTGTVVFYGYKLSKDSSLVEVFTKKPLLILFLALSALVYAGSFYLREHLVAYDLNTDIKTATLAYELSPLLDFWPFLFLVPFFKNHGRLNLMILLPLIIYLGFQIFFLKRAPTVRALTILLAAIALNWKIKTGSVSFIFRLVFGIVIFGLAFYYLIPEELLVRFQTSDTARQEEAFLMIDQLDGFELLFGRGLGGSFYLKDGAGLISLGEGKMGKYILHIGILYPILKGGIILALGIYMHVFTKIHWAWRNLNQLTSYQLSAFTFLLVYSIFRLIEGPFSPGVVFDAFLFGFSLGMLRRDYYYPIKIR